MSNRPAEGAVTFQLVPPGPDVETPNLYSNFIQATVSPLDLTLHFGWYALPALDGPPPPDAVPVEIKAVAKVSIPLPLVRGVIGVLQAQLEAWQTAFGQAVPDQPQPQQQPDNQAVE